MSVRLYASHGTFKLITRSIARFSQQKCNGIIKGWLHCLTSESRGRFLVNNMLANVWLSIMSGHGANPICFNRKKITIGSPENSLTPHPPTSDNISFSP